MSAGIFQLIKNREEVILLQHFITKLFYMMFLGSPRFADIFCIILILTGFTIGYSTGNKYLKRKKVASIKNIGSNRNVWQPNFAEYLLLIISFLLIANGIILFIMQ